MTLPLPDLAYTVYLPQEHTQKRPVLLLHGFATCGDQLWGGTGWFRQYLRAGYLVVTVDLPYHGRPYLKDPQFSVATKLPAGTMVHTGLAQVPAVEEEGDGLASLVVSLVSVLNSLGQYFNGSFSMHQHPAHTVGFSFGARLGWELALTHPEVVTSLVLGGLPLHDHLRALHTMLTQDHLADGTGDSKLTVEPEIMGIFEQIIAASPSQTDALLRFVQVPYAPLDPHKITGGDQPRCPTLVAAGGEDTVARDAHTIFELIRGDNPHNQWLSIPGRNHINALTAGVFRRAALTFAQQTDAALG